MIKKEQVKNQDVSDEKLRECIETIENCTKAVILNPNDANAYYYRGYSKGVLKDHIGAIEDFTKVIVLNPEYAEASRNRALAKEALLDVALKKRK